MSDFGYTSNPPSIVWTTRTQAWTWLTWLNSHSDDDRPEPSAS